MSSENCCRMCLSVTSLDPIFKPPVRNESYADILFLATGLKVHAKDCLPQLICVRCINFVNEFLKFRENCHKVHSILIGKLKYDFTNVDIKIEHITDKNDSKSDIIKEAEDLSCDKGSEHVEKHCDSSIEDSQQKKQCSTLKNNEKENTPSELPPKNKETETVKDYLKAESKKVIEFEAEVQQILRKSTQIIFENLKEFKKVKLEYVEDEEEPKCESPLDKELLIEKDQTFECKYCKKILKSKISLKNHYKIHLGLNVICEHCGKKFMDRRRLMMHCKARHGYEKTDKCSYCDYTACNPDRLKIHERTHTGEKPYTCEECGAGFYRRSSHLQHIAIHLPETTVQREECPATFKSNTLMRVHRSRHRSKRS